MACHRIVVDAQFYAALNHMERVEPPHWARVHILQRIGKMHINLLPIYL